MTGTVKHQRSGVSLLEVLISIGVIAIGIFGVAALIPVAQLKVAEGTSRDRQAAFGPSAAADFRVRMGSPKDWALVGTSNLQPHVPLASPYMNAAQMQTILGRGGFCIDPMGVVESGVTGVDSYKFPWNAPATPTDFGMQRLSLASFQNLAPAARVSLARDMFLLKDDIVVDLPDDQALQPRRQYFLDAATQRPLSPVSNASLSWFATLSRTALGSQDFVLSIVVVKTRVPALGAVEENFAIAQSPFGGEVMLSHTTPLMANQISAADLQIGDWILLAKALDPASNVPANIVYRWTQIIGTDEGPNANGAYGFTISNDDFLVPDTVTNSGGGIAIFMRGVTSVYEKTIRLENTGSWN